MKLSSWFIGSITMAQPDEPFHFESSSLTRKAADLASGSCKVRQEWIEANPEVQLISSCPIGDEFIYKNGTTVWDWDKFSAHEKKFETLNPGIESWRFCK